MTKNYTELVFLLDKSGSMNGLEKDTIGGYNAMLEKQKDVEGYAHVTTVFFNQEVELFHDRLPLSCVTPLSEKDYCVGGLTALLDAIGTTIERIHEIQKAEPQSKRSEKVIFVIVTDGLENASKRFSYSRLQNLIESQKRELNWEFIFLGANMDAIKEAGKFGIQADRSASFVNDSVGIRTNFKTIGKAISAIRTAPSGERLDSSWKYEIETDYKNRSR